MAVQMPDSWRLRAADRALLIARNASQPPTLTDAVTRLSESLCDAIESDRDAESRLPRWGEILTFLCSEARHDWYRTTGMHISFEGEEQ